MFGLVVEARAGWLRTDVVAGEEPAERWRTYNVVCVNDTLAQHESNDRRETSNKTRTITCIVHSDLRQL